MKTIFPLDSLVRISGTDCREWETGETDAENKPLWKNECKEYFIANGILADTDHPFHTLVPGELGCALSHAEIWSRMVDENINYAVVLEDDIEPCIDLAIPLFKSFEIPSDADVLFLSGTDQKYDLGDGVMRDCVRTDGAGRLLGGFGTYGYAITKKGAQRALQAMFPMFLPLPGQWWTRAFTTIENFDSMCPKLKQQGHAYALDNALVRPSKMDNYSTMAINGRKSWRIVK